MIGRISSRCSGGVLCLYVDGFDHLSVLSMGWLGLFIGVLDMWSVQFKSEDHLYFSLNLWGTDYES